MANMAYADSLPNTLPVSNHLWLKSEAVFSYDHQWIFLCDLVLCCTKLKHPQCSVVRNSTALKSCPLFRTGYLLASFRDPLVLWQEIQVTVANSLSQWHLWFRRPLWNIPFSPFVIAWWEAQSVQLLLAAAAPIPVIVSNTGLSNSAVFYLNRGSQNCTRYSLHWWLYIYSQIPIFHFVLCIFLTFNLFGVFFHYYCSSLIFLDIFIISLINILLSSSSKSIQIKFVFHTFLHVILYIHPYFIFRLTTQLLITETPFWDSFNLASSLITWAKLSQLILL